MNRVIRFRAWHNTTISGNYVMSPHEEIVKNCGAYLCDNKVFLDRVIMQFTGLTDKNGVDIYEKDYFDVRGRVYLVIYQDANFRLIDNKSNRSLSAGCLNLIGKVIGNDFENKELRD